MLIRYMLAIMLNSSRLKLDMTTRLDTDENDMNNEYSSRDNLGEKISLSNVRDVAE